jgi:cytochrome c553
MNFLWMVAVEFPRRAGAKRAAAQQTKENMKKLVTTTVAFMAGAWLTAYAGDAKENWEKSCAKCHGADGKGQTKMGTKLGVKDLTDAKVQADVKDDAAFKAIKEGLKDKEGKTLHKPSEGLSDDDIRALIKHLRGFKK